MKIIVIGCGTIGETVIEHVSKEGHTLVIIDNNKRKVESLIEKYDVMGVIGNGASYAIQEEAGVSSADLVVVLTSSDELNILACMVAKKLGAKSTIVRVREPDYIKQAELMKDELGISLSINPEQETASEIAKQIYLPSITKMESFAKGSVNLIEFMVEEGNPLIGETLITMSKKVHTKVLICAVQRRDEVIIPNGNFRITKGDKLSIASDTISIMKFLNELHLIKSQLKNVMLIGGGKISYYLTKELLEKKYNVKLIEHSLDRAKLLAEHFPTATTIYGDGSDQALLLEEGIETTDALVSLTNIDEENLIISLYAKKMKVTKVITKLKRNTYANLMDDLEIANTVSPKEIVANKIVTHIRAISNKRGSNVITLYKLVDGKIEALEFIAKKKERFFGKPLRDLKIKENCLIACIVRGKQVIIPSGNDFIQENDDVLVITTHQNFDDLKDAFE